MMALSVRYYTLHSRFDHRHVKFIDLSYPRLTKQALMGARPSLFPARI